MRKYDPSQSGSLTPPSPLVTLWAGDVHKKLTLNKQKAPCSYDEHDGDFDLKRCDLAGSILYFCA